MRGSKETMNEANKGAGPTEESRQVVRPAAVGQVVWPTTPF